MIDSLRAVVRSIDPQLPLNHVQSMEQVVSEGQASRRFNTVLISSFALAAVLLAVLGIYSVIAFSAALRTHELAIRMAMGASVAACCGWCWLRARSSAWRVVLSAEWQRFSPRGCFARCCSM